MRNRNEEPWDDSPAGNAHPDSNRTMPLDDDRTEVLDNDRTQVLNPGGYDDRTEVLDEDRTQVLDDDRTEVLRGGRGDDNHTRVLDHGSWGSATSDDANMTRPLPAYGSRPDSPSAQRRSGLEYDDAAPAPEQRRFTPAGYPAGADPRGSSPEGALGGSHSGHAGYQGQTPSGRDLKTMVLRRQKSEYGRLQLLPGLIGWLVAMALVGFMTWALGAVGPALLGEDQPDTLGASLRELTQSSGGSGALWLIGFGAVFFVAYLVGGYAAGRAGRFAGAKQGVAVWLWQLMGAAVTTVLTLFLGDRVTPSVPLGSIQSLGGGQIMWGIAAAVGVLIIGLIAAILGGLWGTRFHRSVDRWGFEAR